MADERVLHVSGPERIGYEVAYERQRDLVGRCLDSGGRDNYLMLVEHPPVITIGRSSEGEDLLAGARLLEERGVEVVQTNRGGKATFHGPGQLVIYPIIDLRARGRDLHRYLRDLENWLIRLLDSYGIKGGTNPPHTGVWVGQSKVASIGIAVRRWISYHGIALNLNNDMSFFDLIVPCGLPDVRMKSMSGLLGRELDFDQVARRAARMFREDFNFPGRRTAE
jgi:lipoate-protein ligase B